MSVFDPQSNEYLILGTERYSGGGSGGDFFQLLPFDFSVLNTEGTLNNRNFRFYLRCDNQDVEIDSVQDGFFDDTGVFYVNNWRGFNYRIAPSYRGLTIPIYMEVKEVIHISENNEIEVDQSQIKDIIIKLPGIKHANVSIFPFRVGFSDFFMFLPPEGNYDKFGYQWFGKVPTKFCFIVQHVNYILDTYVDFRITTQTQTTIKLGEDHLSELSVGPLTKYELINESDFDPMNPNPNTYYLFYEDKDILSNDLYIYNIENNSIINEITDIDVEFEVTNDPYPVKRFSYYSFFKQLKRRKLTIPEPDTFLEFNLDIPAYEIKTFQINAKVNHYLVLEYFSDHPSDYVHIIPINDQGFVTETPVVGGLGDLSCSTFHSTDNEVAYTIQNYGPSSIVNGRFKISYQSI